MLYRVRFVSSAINVVLTDCFVSDFQANHNQSFQPLFEILLLAEDVSWLGSIDLVLVSVCAIRAILL